MNKREKTLLKKILHKGLEVIGVFFVFLGVIGLFLPIVPTVPFLIIGILILGEESIYTGWIFKLLPAKVSSPIRKGLEKARKKLGAENGK